MRRPSRDAIMTLGFVVLSFALAFWQRPGRASSDTKIDLHVDPVAFLGQVASAWTPAIDLGVVHSAQYTGYLWPMGPFFAALHSVDLSPWVVHRLWLGVLYALSAWGMLRLLDVVAGRPRGVAHAVAALFYVANPYTTVFSARSSVALIGYAALPWLLLLVHHGVRDVRGWGGWRGWWCAAAFALVLTSLGGGINGAVVGWMLVGPLVLLVYEPLVGAVRWRDSANLLARMGLLGTLASLWWIAPLLVHAGYGADFLQFTEQPRTIWSTNNAAEALRLMAYWTSYVGVDLKGFTTPLFTESATLLFNPLVVGASLLLPALAVAGFVWTRRVPYAPFLLLILIVGAVIELAGFPDGTPARRAMLWLYREVPLLAFMRTTQKAAPLVAVGTAGLLGLGAGVAWARLRALGPGAAPRVARVAAPAGLVALIALAALPLVRGTAVEKQLTWERIPPAWEQAGVDLDRELPDNARALVLPGQIFAYYDWGGTVDHILPRLTDRPVAVRYQTPYGDAHATDLLFTVDRLVQQRRLLPGQLTPLLRLMGVGAVVTGTDDDTRRSGAVDPVAAARTLAAQGLGRPSRTYGPSRALPPPPGDVGPATALPQVRRQDVPEGRGLVHVAPAGPATVVDGSAEGLAAMAAFGALPERAPILYAGDLSDAALRRHAARGAEVVITDSNRRRRFAPEFTEQTLGPTLREDEHVDPNNASIDPFPDRGSAAQTVAAPEGVRYLRAPSMGALLLFPERAPIAAFDGDPETLWAADRFLPPRDRWIEVGFERPRDVPYVDLLPVRNWRGIEAEVDVAGVRARLGPGVTRVRVGLRDVSALRITLTRVVQPPGDLRGAGGFREIRIPGLSVRQPLRPPVLAARALAGRDLRRTGLTWLFERTTADAPFERDRVTGSPIVELAQNRQDPEQAIDRLVFAPAERRYAADAWVQPAVDASDALLDRITGTRTGGSTFDSSDRFHNRAANRASSAFDDRAGTAWLAVWARPSAPPPWISWTTPRPATVARLRLTPAPAPARRPVAVRVSWDGGRTPVLPVAADGTVDLPRPATGRRFRLTVVHAVRPPGTAGGERSSRAVGLTAVDVAGTGAVRAPAAGPLRAACGTAAVRVAGRTVPLRPRGTVGDLLAGRPLRARACSGEVRMGGGVQAVQGVRRPFAVDLLRLRSPAPRPLPAPQGGGRVVDSGRLGNSSLDGVRVALDGPSWLVLGQSFSEGWEASCDGRSLGTPQPVGGYANGWRAPAGCRDVAFRFAPQATVRAGYAVSGVAGAVLLAFVLAGALRACRRRPEPRTPLPADRPQRLALPRAAALAFALTVPLCLLFALRTSLLIFPALTLILWRGVGAAALTGAAAALLGIVVPLVYLIASPRDLGGYNVEYGVETIWAHWAAVGALVLLMAACGRMLAAARRGRRRPGPWPAGDRSTGLATEPGEGGGRVLEPARR